MRKLTILLLIFPLLCVGQKPLVHGKKGLVHVNKALTYTITTPVPPFTPTDLDSLKLWLKADAGVTKDGSNNVTGWADQSGYGNDASVAVVAPTWVDSVLNGLPIIRFTGASSTALQVADDPSIDFYAGFTMFVVLKQTTLSATQTIMAKWDYNTQGCWGWGAYSSDQAELQMYIADALNDGGGNNVYSTDALITNANFYILESKYDAGTVQFYKDATALTMATNGVIAATLQNSSATLKIGMFGGALSRYLTGDIAEIVIYSRALTDGERGQVETYLQNKWGL